MTEKNRFSRLLEHLMSVAEVKNVTLAQMLQYDVSYISKWVSGKILPSEKTEREILEGISKCIVSSASDSCRETLFEEYQVDTSEDLEMAIFDNLEVEYFYVKDLQKSTGHEVAPKTFYYPELSLEQFVSKIRHPVLRRVRSLDIVAAMDLFNLEQEPRIQSVRVGSEHDKTQREYPDVHYSLLVNIRKDKWDYIHDTLFIIYLLVNNMCIDFQLYGDTQSAGHMVFAVKEDYSITGVLIGKNQCISVLMSEEASTCNIIYKNIKTLCTIEKLLFRKTTMRNIIESHDYVHSLFSMKTKWIIGKMTEHFMPEDLLKEILGQPGVIEKIGVSYDELTNVYQMMKNIVREASIDILVEKSALSKFAITGEMDFYGCNITLTPEQRSRYLEHLLSLCKTNESLNIKMINGHFISAFELIYNQSVFLSDTVSYLRLNGEVDKNNLYIINRYDMREIFERSFDEFWNYREGVVISDKEEILTYIQHVVLGGI